MSKKCFIYLLILTPEATSELENGPTDSYKPTGLVGSTADNGDGNASVPFNSDWFTAQGKKNIRRKSTAISRLFENAQR